jgi:uncharacterized protein YdeI (YjbR/CyaY-like superfamily)
MKQARNLPTHFFETDQAWEAWLEENHDRSEGVLIKFAKKNSGIQSVSSSEAVETALCFGWIDSQAASFDDSFWLLRFTPRTPKSKWSARNRETAMRLDAQGRLRDAGRRAIESAKQDGRWNSPPRVSSWRGSIRANRGFGQCLRNMSLRLIRHSPSPRNPLPVTTGGTSQSTP